MAILILRPNSNVVTALQPFGSGTGNYGRVNESVADDTNGVYWAGIATVDRFGLPDPSQSGTINSVTLYARAWRQTSAYETVQASSRLGVYIGSTSYYSAAKALGSAAGTISQAWATNPNTGSAWTWANINDLQAILEITGGAWVEGKNNGSFNGYASQLWVEVDYTSVSVPTVTTQAAAGVTDTGCTGNGTITATGGATVTRRGFCYVAGTSGEPTTADTTAYDDGSFGTGAFTKAISGLSPGTGYRVRAYAVNSAGTSYGATVQVTTSAAAPTVTTQAATGVTDTGCTGNGTITATGGATVTRRGFCYVAGTSGEPTVGDSVAYDDGSFGTGAFTKAISGLSPGTGYRVRAYAVNSAGTSYGATVQVTTSAAAPTVTTQAATGVTDTGCTGNGTITATGGATVTRRGFCYVAGTSGEPTTSDSVAYDDGSFGTGAYTKAISGLSPGTGYRVRAYAVNSAGTSYGATVQVTTTSAGATVTTQAATGVTATGCTGNGNITSIGGSTVTRRGFCYIIGTTGDPTTANNTAYDDGSFGTGAFTKAISGLSPGTGYRVRAYAVNAGGTSYGSSVQITTSTTNPTVTTQDATDVTSGTCTGNGTITATGGVTVNRRGFCYMAGTTGDPTVGDTTAYDDGSFGTGAFTKAISGLSPNTGYRVRAYAVNSVGTSYGATVQITTTFIAPTVTTQAATGVTATGCTGNGNITSIGGTNATRRGFCYLAGTTGDPTTANNTAYDDGSFGTGAYTKAISGLQAGTAYRVRAYAVNAGGTSYGATVDVTTSIVAPTVVTQEASDVTGTECTGNGEITATGGATVTRRGFCFMAGTTGDPTTANSVAYDDDSFGTGAFTKAISGLTANTSYRVRAYAINSVGTSYGATVQVITAIVVSTLTTEDATDITETGFTGNGTITATGGATVTRRGFCYMAGTTGDPTTANSVAYDDGSFGTGSFIKALTGLLSGTGYRVRAYAVNSVGTSYGATVQITTTFIAPTVTTQAATGVTATGCTGNGNITSIGGTNATRRGFCYLAGTTGDPTTANSVAYDDGSFGTGAFTKAISGLSPGIGYRVRAYAENISGTSYGATVDVTTSVVAPTVTTAAPTGVTDTNCTGYGVIESTGGSAVTRRGFCYMAGTSGDPTVANFVAYDDGSFGAGAYTKYITGLTANSNYRIRAYAINAQGTSYGITLQMTTAPVPVKRAFNANFILEKNKRADGPKPINLITVGFATPVYLSDRTVTPQGGPDHQGLVKTWGFIDTSLTRTPGSGVLGSIDISDIEITLINAATPRFSDNFTTADPPENVTVSVYQWFGGTVYAEKEIIFKGTVYGAIRYDEYTCTMTVRGIFDKYNKQIGADNLITAARYPLADPDDVGKMSNIGYGSLRDVPCRAVKAGVIDSLRDDLTINATSFYVSGDVVVDYPNGTVIVQMDSEQISGTYSRTTHQFTACTRGYGGTTATAHDKGAQVAQVLTEYIYEVFGHPAHAIGDVRVDGIKQTTGFAAYTGQTGNVLTGYENRAVIRFTALPIVKKQVNLNISEGSHAHSSAVSIRVWKLDSVVTDGTNPNPGAALILDGNMTTGAVLGVSITKITFSKSQYESESGAPQRFRLCVRMISGGSGKLQGYFGVLYNNYAGLGYGLSSGDYTYKTAWVTCDNDTNTWDKFNGLKGEITNYQGTAECAEVWVEVEYTPGTSASGATGVALSGNSSADTVIGTQVTVDASGYRDDASGTYTGVPASLIERPDHVFKHLWAVIMGAPVADINVAALSAAGAFYAANAYKFALLVNQPVCAAEVLMRLALQCRSRFIVTAYGRATLYVRQLGQTSQHAIIKNEIKRDSLSIERSTTGDIINMFNVSYDLDQVKGDGSPESYNSVIKFSDATSITRYGQREWKGGQDVFCFHAVRLGAMAQHVGQYYLDYHKRARKLPCFGVFLDNIEIEPGDIIDITHPLDNMAGFIVEVAKVIHHIGNKYQIDWIEINTVENGT